MSFKILNRKKVFEHPWERIYIEKIKIGSGEQSEYLISEPNDFVIIVPFIGQEKVLMVSQYKHGAKRDLLGFPAGFLKKGEKPTACAERELFEEVGLKGKNAKIVATLFENPTRCRSCYYLIFVDVVIQGHKPKKNPDAIEGDIETKEIPIQDLLSSEVLMQMKGSPMLSALPFIFQKRKASGCKD